MSLALTPTARAAEDGKKRAAAIGLQQPATRHRTATNDKTCSLSNPCLFACGRDALDAEPDYQGRNLVITVLGQSSRSLLSPGGIRGMSKASPRIMARDTSEARPRIMALVVCVGDNLESEKQPSIYRGRRECRAVADYARHRLCAAPKNKCMKPQRLHTHRGGHCHLGFGSHDDWALLYIAATALTRTTLHTCSIVKHGVIPGGKKIVSLVGRRPSPGLRTAFALISEPRTQVAEFFSYHPPRSVER